MNYVTDLSLSDTALFGKDAILKFVIKFQGTFSLVLSEI